MYFVQVSIKQQLLKYRIEFFRRKKLSDLLDIEQHSKKVAKQTQFHSLNLLLPTVWHSYRTEDFVRHLSDEVEQI